MATKNECSEFWEQKAIKENVFKGFSDEKSKQAGLEYQQKCGMYDEKELKCIAINSKLALFQARQKGFALSNLNANLESSALIERTKKEFNDNDCLKIVEKYRQGELGNVVKSFSGLDKMRIESASIYQRNQRIFFGGLVLVAGVVIFTMFGKNK